MLQVLEQVSKRKLPFVVTFGNHDNEQGMTREQLYDIICQVPGNLDAGSWLGPFSGLCIDREKPLPMRRRMQPSCIAWTLILTPR